MPTNYDLPVGARIPPQALEIEAVVLGTLMLESAAFDRIGDVLHPPVFYHPPHQAIYEAILNLKGIGMQVDILTVVEALRATGKLEFAGGPYGITKLTNTVTSSSHLESHVLILLQLYQRRETIHIAMQAVRDAYDDTTDVVAMQEQLEADLLRLNSHLQGQNYYDALTLATEHLQRVDAMANRTIGLTGVPTGYRSLNRLTNGWQPGNLIILAARPSVGKTAFAINLIHHAATDPEKPTGVGFFSCEMSAGEITNRFAALMAEIDLDHIQNNRMTETERHQHRQAMDRFSRLNIRLDETGGITIHQLRRKARQMVLKHGCGLIVVDYLQLMSGDREKNGTREQEISAISRSLKALAKELKVPIIALSQLSRAIETRQNKEPMLSDLRESGAIEQDADVVIFLSRADYGQKQNEADSSLRGNALIKFAKNRNGDLETLAFQTQLCKMQWKEYGQFD